MSISKVYKCKRCGSNNIRTRTNYWFGDKKGITRKQCIKCGSYKLVGGMMR